MIDTPALRQEGFDAMKARSLLAPVTVLAGVGIAWQVAVVLGGVKPYLLPAPSQIWIRAVQDRALLADNLEITLIEMLLGFAAAAAAAFLCGVAITYSLTLRRSLYPLIVLFHTIPVVAFAPLLVIWFGYNIWPRIVITALVAFFPMVVNVVAGFASVERERIDFFRSLNAGPIAIFFRLALPTALPGIFTGLKVIAVLAVIGATVSEWIGADAGLGHLASIESMQLETDRVFASIAVMSAIGISMFCAVVVVEWMICPWHYHDRRASVPVRLAEMLPIRGRWAPRDMPDLRQIADEH